MDDRGRPILPTPRPDPGAPPEPKPPIPEPPEPEPPKPEPSQAVTRVTPFRHTGGLTPDRFCELLDGYPLVSECRQIHKAVKGQGLPLAQSFKESQYGKTARGNNPLGLMESDGRTLMVFPNWTASFVEWQRRMDDPTYKGGVYMPETMSLEQYIYTYVGGPGCWSTHGQTCANGETKATVELYLKQTIDRLNRYAETEAPEPQPEPEPGTITFGRVPKPANYVEHILAPNGPNTAWDNLGARIPRGIVLHRMLGTLIGTDTYFANDARNRALTDFGIGKGADGRHGRIVTWIPFNAPVAPWASGPADGIDGDGTAFWNRYKGDPIGTSIFNRDCRSIEIEGNYDTPVPDEDYQALVQLVSWLVDGWLRIPYTRWPLNNDGVHCLLGHSEITNQKPCPGEVVYRLVPRLVEDVRQRLRSYQAATS